MAELAQSAAREKLRPLCYTQISGLTVATFITLLLVPVLYATFVLDLKLVRWEAHERQLEGAPPDAHSVLA